MPFECVLTLLSVRVYAVPQCASVRVYSALLCVLAHNSALSVQGVCTYACASYV